MVNNLTIVNTFIHHILQGADLGFSRGGGADFQKNFENFYDLFRSTKLIFRALLKHLKRGCFGPFWALLGKFRQ